MTEQAPWSLIVIGLYLLCVIGLTAWGARRQGAWLADRRELLTRVAELEQALEKERATRRAVKRQAQALDRLVAHVVKD